MKKKLIVSSSYITYLFLIVITNFILNQYTIHNEINHLILIVYVSSFIIALAVIEGITLYHLKSYRTVLHVLVIVLTFITYFNNHINHLYFMTIQIIIILSLWIIPFFIIYDSKNDEDKRISAFVYSFSQILLVFMTMFMIIKIDNVLLIILGILFLYIVLQYQKIHLKQIIISVTLVFILLLLSWLSSDVVVSNDENVYSFKVFYLVAVMTVLIITMRYQRNTYLIKIDSFKEKE